MKKQTLLLFGILVATMSSCVYSLFPIYTENTLVFKEELLGKWMVGKDDYFLFETMGSNDEDKSKGSNENEYKYSIEIKEGFTMSSNDPIFILLNGKPVYDEDSIKLIMLERMAKADLAKENEPKELLDAKEQIEDNDLTPSDIEFNGTVTVSQEKSYRLIYIENNEEKEAYTAHLVDIGGELFMDLYPIKEYDSKNVSDNYFPVHTFYKVSVTEKEFTMTHFDLDKLNKLFESNLIRLRHENVDGTILITAQPKELQKFIDKYSDDKSVFEEAETYIRAL